MLANIRSPDSFIITPRFDAMLVNTSEVVLSDEEIEIVRQLTQKPRGSRIGSFTGSQAGSCERMQILKFIGLEPLYRVQPVLHHKFIDGTWRHIRWQIFLPRAIPGTVIEKRVDSKKFNMRGSVDFAHLEERWGGELKGWSNMKTILVRGPLDYHQWQAGRYWLATDEDPTWGDKPLDKWVYIYEDKRSQEWREIVVNRNTKTEQIVLRELKSLNQAVRDHDLPPVLKGCTVGKGPDFRECPFSDRCPGFRTWDEAEASAKGQEAPVVFRRRKLPHHKTK
jgi:hypothetical protein